MTLLSRLSEVKLLTAPRFIFAARLVGGLSAAANLMLGLVCLLLLVRGDWLGLVLGVTLLLPSAAYLLAWRSPLAGTRAFAAVFLLVWFAWTLNEMLPCDPGQCNVSGFLVVALPNFAVQSTLTLLLAAVLFYAAHRLQSRPAPQQVSST